MPGGSVWICTTIFAYTLAMPSNFIKQHVLSVWKFEMRLYEFFASYEFECSNCLHNNDYRWRKAKICIKPHSFLCYIARSELACDGWNSWNWNTLWWMYPVPNEAPCFEFVRGSVSTRPQSYLVEESMVMYTCDRHMNYSDGCTRSALTIILLQLNKGNCTYCNI